MSHLSRCVLWEDIAAQDKVRYAASLGRMEVSAIFAELGEHNHNLANSAIRKFRWLRLGFRMALVAIALSAGVIVVSGS